MSTRRTTGLFDRINDTAPINSIGIFYSNRESKIIQVSHCSSVRERLRQSDIAKVNCIGDRGLAVLVKRLGRFNRRVTGYRLLSDRIHNLRAILVLWHTRPGMAPLAVLISSQRCLRSHACGQCDTVGYVKRHLHAAGTQKAFVIIPGFGISLGLVVEPLILPYLLDRQIDRVITGIGDSDGTIHARDNRDLKRIVRDCDLLLILGSRHLVAVRRAARLRAGDAFCDGVGASLEAFERVAAVMLQGSRCVNNVPRRILHGERERIVVEVARRQVCHVLGDRQVSGLRDEGVDIRSRDRLFVSNRNGDRPTIIGRSIANCACCCVLLYSAWLDFCNRIRSNWQTAQNDFFGFCCRIDGYLNVAINKRRSMRSLPLIKEFSIARTLLELEREVEILITRLESTVINRFLNLYSTDLQYPTTVENRVLTEDNSRISHFLSKIFIIIPPIKSISLTRISCIYQASFDRMFGINRKHFRIRIVVIKGRNKARLIRKLNDVIDRNYRWIMENRISINVPTIIFSNFNISSAIRGICAA